MRLLSTVHQVPSQVLLRTHRQRAEKGLKMATTTTEQPTGDSPHLTFVLLKRRGKNPQLISSNRLTLNQTVWGKYWGD